MITALEAKTMTTLIAMTKIEIIDEIILESIEKGRLSTPFIKASKWLGDFDEILCTDVLRDYYTSLGYKFVKYCDKDIKITWGMAN